MLKEKKRAGQVLLVRDDGTLEIRKMFLNSVFVFVFHSVFSSTKYFFLRISTFFQNTKVVLTSCPMV